MYLTQTKELSPEDSTRASNSATLVGADSPCAASKTRQCFTSHCGEYILIVWQWYQCLDCLFFKSTHHEHCLLLRVPHLCSLELRGTDGGLLVLLHLLPLPLAQNWRLFLR